MKKLYSLPRGRLALACTLFWLTTFGVAAQEYEAESGAYSNGAGQSNCAACSGQKMAGNLGSGAVDIAVNVPAAGTYNLLITYCTGDQRTINVTPNGGTPVAITCPPSGGWEAPAAIRTMITLNAGANTLRFDNVYSYGPNIDKITLSPAATPSLQTIAFGTNSRIEYDLANGLYDVYFRGTKIIGGAWSSAYSNQIFNSNAGYTARSYSSSAVNDAFGSGTRHVITSTGPGLIDMQQVFYTYPGREQYFTEVVLSGNGANCYKMSPLTTNYINIQSNGDRRGLLVPYDNDAWVRYEAKEMRYTTIYSGEVTAIYDNTSRKGVVMGSVEHKDWKTGVNLVGEGRVESWFASVIAGWTSQSQTRDKRGHGWVNVGQTTCKSPRISVSYDDDWRTGLEEYGRFNALAEPRYIANWTKATPFAWNSWGAIQQNITLAKGKAVADFISTGIPAFRNGDSTVYVDLDSYWDNLTPGGWSGDFSQLTEFANYCKSKGLKPGIYWAPFVDWGKYSRQMEGSTYTYDQCWTKVNGGPVELDGAYALDPTHPGTKERIAYLIGKFKACGFEMIKIDFLGHASLEADSFYQSGVYTGMQAYRVGMEYLIDQLDGKMLVYAAISPNLATGRYAHMRRIACDAYSDTWESAYTLNSTNYGWWQDQIYPYIDGDHVVFGSQSAGKNRLRLASSILTGTLVTGDDYSGGGPWIARSQDLLQNTDLLLLARDGKAFRPVEGNTGWDPNELFVKTLNGRTYLAVLNFGSADKAYSVDLGRAGLNASASYQARELFSGTVPGGRVAAVTGTLNVTVPASDVMLFELAEGSLPVTLLRFDARREGRSAVLQWSTATEKNAGYFSIQHSRDGRTWKTIGKVSAKGESTVRQSYSFTDQTPVSGANYYRLMAVDRDRTAEYSPVSSVVFDDRSALYPNPVQESFRLEESDLSLIRQVRITDLQGRLVATPELKKDIFVGNLPQGVYLVEVTRVTGVGEVYRMVKK